MARRRVTVKGADQTAKAFHRASDRLEDRAMRETHEDAGTVLESQARRLVPVRRGTLRGTIRTEVVAGGSVTVAGGRRAPYARPIHYGWPARNIRRQPFLGPGAPDRSRQVEAVYDDRVESIVRTFGREAP